MTERVSSSKLPKISIITTSMNSSKTLEQTIQSVLDQTYKNVEFIIVDGKSSDGTIELVQKYSDRIAYWVSEKDGCVSEAVNKGILRATGDIIFNLPSDDFIAADFCEKMAVCFEQWGNRADYIYGDVIMCDASGKPLYKMMGQRINFFGVKKQVHDQLGCYDENLTLNNDVDFLQRMDRAGKKGVYCAIARWMRMGGASEKGRLKGLWLLRKIERKNGRSYIWTFSRYLIRLALYSVEYFIRHCFGLKSLFKFYDVKFVIKKSLRFNW